MTVLEQTHEPRAKPHPIVQEALRQERLQFFNPFISHAKARDGSGRSGEAKGENWNWV
jgi:hypothetical protein